MPQDADPTALLRWIRVKRTKATTTLGSDISLTSLSRPIRSICVRVALCPARGPVLKGLGQVCYVDLVGTAQVRDGAGELLDAVEAPRR